MSKFTLDDIYSRTIKPPILLFEGFVESPILTYQHSFEDLTYVSSTLKPWYIDEAHRLFDAKGQVIRLMALSRSETVTAVPTMKYDQRAFYELLITNLQDMSNNDRYIVPTYDTPKTMVHALINTKAHYTPFWKALWLHLSKPKPIKPPLNPDERRIKYGQGMFRIRPWQSSPLDTSFLDRF